jgi:hypothetical protein
VGFQQFVQARYPGIGIKGPQQTKPRPDTAPPGGLDFASQQTGRHLTAFKQAVTRYTDTLLWIVNQRWMEFRLHQGASFFL